MITYIRSIFISPDVGSLEVPRSPHWSTIRKRHLEIQPTCAACGGVKNLQVHHCMPFHIDQSKELDQDNLITLCEEHNCHLIFGHLYNWHSYNANVREDAAVMLEKVKSRPQT